MQTSTVSPVTNFTTVFSNTTITTKSKDQILVQSSGAMIALIVIGIVIILTILLIVLKTYNRWTHVSRVLGNSGGSKARQKKSSSSTVQSSIPMSNVGVSSVSGSGSGSFANSNTVLENGFRLPRVELNSTDRSNIEQFSTTSGSTVVTIHDNPSLEHT